MKHAQAHTQPNNQAVKSCCLLTLSTLIPFRFRTHQFGYVYAQRPYSSGVFELKTESAENVCILAWTNTKS